MNTSAPNHSSSHDSRRTFLKAASVIAAASALPVARSAHAAGSDEIRVALIGCGGRGTAAAVEALRNKALPNVKLVALADAFEDRVEASYKTITTQLKEQVDVPPERRFAGLDAYEKALACDAHLVLLCGPPGFRPAQFEAAVKAGKHVFMEKPVATDAPGVRRIMAANEDAKKKGLLVAVGHHLRHEVKQDLRRDGPTLVKPGADGIYACAMPGTTKVL